MTNYQPTLSAASHSISLFRCLRLLQGSSIRSPRRSILERLQKRYPSVGPEEVNVVAAELARLLRHELETDQTTDQPGSNRIALW